MDTSNSTPISNSSTNPNTSSTSSSTTEQKSSSTPQNKPTTQSVGGDQKNETKKTEVTKENKDISAS